MRRTLALPAALLLAGCGAFAGGGSESSAGLPASGGGTQTTDQARRLQDGNVSGGPAGSPPAAPGTPPAVPRRITSMATHPAGSRVQKSVDVIIDLSRPGGNRDAAPYLSNPDEWKIADVEQLSPSVKRIRFMRVNADDPANLIDVDVAKPLRRPDPPSTPQPIR